MIKKCEICNKEFEPHDKWYPNQKTCSKECAYKLVSKKNKISLKGKSKSKEAIEKTRLANIGKKHPHKEETKIKIGLANRNKNLKENTSLSSIHNWVRRRKPKPQFCECCKINEPYDLANISGEYRRDINDYEWLCRGCHMRKDGRLLKTICLAKSKAKYFTEEEIKEHKKSYLKEYYQKNKNIIKKRSNEYYQIPKNKLHKKEYDKLYYKNSEVIKRTLKNSKKWRDKNKEIIKQKRREKHLLTGKW